jgi:subtilisin family serine protease
LATYGRNGKGVAVVFSAGNEGAPIAQLNTEATINSAITVGALDAHGVALASSNYGEGVDVSVFGAGVKSTTNQGGYHQFSGTSLSAAIVSGLAAL